MKNYILYSDNGQIIKTGQCQDDDFYLQGSNIIEGIANDAENYIENGKIIEMPPKPQKNSYFDYDLKQWVLNYFVQEQEIQLQRNELLYKSDWTQIPNRPLTIEQQQSWAVYRQELRDITSQSGYPFNITWPTPPQ